MGFRFRQSVRLLPGIRLNFSTRGVSTSVGGRGFTLNFGKRGIRTTVGIPGTGISYSEMLTRSGSDGNSGGAAPVTGSSFGWKTWVFIVLAVVFLTRMLGGPEAGRTTAPDAVATPVPAELVLSTAVVTARSLNCRADPTKEARIIRQFSRNTVVGKLEVRQVWVRVKGLEVNGTTTPSSSCWVARRFLRHGG
jgi:hypothetical protein